MHAKIDARWKMNIKNDYWYNKLNSSVICYFFQLYNKMLLMNIVLY